MARYPLFLALTFLALGTVAAQAAGDSAVLIRVSNVRLPSSLPGVCQVNGVINQVLDGKTYRAGQPLSLQVPCGSLSRATPLLPAVQEHGVRLVDPDVLAATKLGGAHIDDTGRLIWKPTRSFGNWGAIGGFRILEGVPLRMQHA
jgi:hypothetical protein